MEISTDVKNFNVELKSVGLSTANNGFFMLLFLYFGSFHLSANDCFAILLYLAILL